jgi:hypothetical protein
VSVEHFGVPSSPRDARAFELTGRRATDDLAGRTVWCVCGLPRGRDLAARLAKRLEWAGDDGVSSGRVGVEGHQAFQELGRRLDEILHGRPPEPSELGPADAEIYDDGVRSGESLLGDGLGRDDVVVLHDALSAAVAEAIRERGAHAVWHLTLSAGRPAEAAHDFLRRHTGFIDAYVTTWRRPVGRGLVEESITAVMPCADLVAARRLGAEDPRDEDHRLRTEEVGWSALLADVVRGDRHQTVGGTRGARPGVAAR